MVGPADLGIAAGTSSRLTMTTSNGEPIDAVPAALQGALQPATHVVREWDEHIVRCDGATHLRVGSMDVHPIVTGSNLFQVQFVNRLGLVSIRAFRDLRPLSEPLWVEVLAEKLGTPEASVAFLEALLADLFGAESRLPYAIAAESQRWVVETHRPPTPLFTYHFFRQRVETVTRAVQAVLGAPHRRLDEEDVRVKPHEVRHLSTTDVSRLLQAGAIAPDRGGPMVGRIRTQHVYQRVPIETYDTPENRFVVAAARAMLDALERLRQQSWFDGPRIPGSERANIRDVDIALSALLRDRRFASLAAATQVPGQSRVLQRKHGYREVTLLWQLFARAWMPVFEHLQTAIDLRSIDAMYELWALFAIVKEIERETGVTPAIHGHADAAGGSWRADFPKHGVLHYQKTLSAYSRVSMIPDFLWKPDSGRWVALDAKFRLNSGGEVMVEGEAMQVANAKSDDLVKMHAYRDGVAEVGACIVVFPGTGRLFRSVAGERVDLTWQRIVAGDLEGVGAMPMRPVTAGGVG